MSEAFDRGKQDALDGYRGSDWADLADIIVKNTSDNMDVDEYNKICQQIKDDYAKGYQAGRKKKLGGKIAPHKGGRTIGKRTDVTPEVANMLAWLSVHHKISLGDLVDEIARQKYHQLKEA